VALAKQTKSAKLAGVFPHGISATTVDTDVGNGSLIVDLQTIAPSEYKASLSSAGIKIRTAERLIA
jgi:hypothetical protein